MKAHEEYEPTARRGRLPERLLDARSAWAPRSEQRMLEWLAGVRFDFRATEWPIRWPKWAEFRNSVRVRWCLGCFLTTSNWQFSDHYWAHGDAAGAGRSSTVGLIGWFGRCGWRMSAIWGTVASGRGTRELGSRQARPPRQSTVREKSGRISMNLVLDVSRETQQGLDSGLGSLDHRGGVEVGSRQARPPVGREGLERTKRRGWRDAAGRRG